MKKVCLVFVILLSVIFFAENSLAQTIAGPPLLLQQVPAPPPAPGVSPGQPVAPPPPGPGMAVGQTIPPSILLTNLTKAVAAVKRLGSRLSPGKVWIGRGPGGEIEIKAGLLYQGIVIAALHFDPRNGRMLPLGISPHAYQIGIQLAALKARLANMIKKLKILSAAEFVDPEVSWSFPVALGNTIVTHVKVYYDGTHIVQDYAASQEMMFYGQ
ncbi:MAG: hypothetical protein JRJ12_08595 [Deltaproteobacteria bacterium]|nr:hypothetical protein [Deltaproteobacteria bacterium]MBW2071565.1 hypothetical protein [Deltaproteobacteria bacterium]